MTAVLPRAAPAGLRAEILVEDAAWSADLPGLEALAARAVAAVAAGSPAGALPAHAAEFALVFADDALLRRLNRDYRGLDRPTNVLAFATRDGVEHDPPADTESGAGFAEPLGDVLLARETVLREARQQGKPPAHHVTHLVVHGTLHLLGYDHQDETDAETMEALETAILAALGMPDPYAEAESPVAAAAPS